LYTTDTSFLEKNKTLPFDNRPQIFKEINPKYVDNIKSLKYQIEILSLYLHNEDSETDIKVYKKISDVLSKFDFYSHLEITG